MMDSRGGRCLTPDRRSIFDDDEWDWIVEHATGDFDHLVIGTSLPFLLGPGMHYVEAWNEAVCNGAWGGSPRAAGEWIRRELDLEHWAAFDDLLRAPDPAARGGRLGQAGQAAGLDRRDLRRRPPRLPGRCRVPAQGRSVKSAVYQATCSPMRNPLDESEKRMIRIGDLAASATHRPRPRPLARAWRDSPTSAGASARARCSTTKWRR